jgi:hypothetical protein
MKSTSDEMVDKQKLKQKMVDILEFVADREEVMSNLCFTIVYPLVIKMSG